MTTNGATLSLHDDQIAVQRAREATLRFLSFRLRSVQEVTTYLTGKRFPKTVVEQTMSYLTETGLVDDHKFAQWWTESRMHGGWGPRRIVQELKMKGVNKEIIDEEVKQRDWTEIAQTVLEKEQKKFMGLSPMKRRQKITQRLLGRGFTYGQIAHLVDEKERNR